MTPDDTLTLDTVVNVLITEGERSWNYPKTVRMDLGTYVHKGTDTINITKIRYGYKLILVPRYVALDDVVFYAPDVDDRNLIELDNIGTVQGRYKASEVL